MFYCTRYRSRWNCYIERTSSVRLIFDIRSLTFERVCNERHSFFKIKIQQIIMGWLIFFANSNSSEFSYFHKSNSRSTSYKTREKRAMQSICVSILDARSPTIWFQRDIYTLTSSGYIFIYEFFLFFFFCFFFFFSFFSRFHCIHFFSFFFILHLIVNAQLARDQRFL